MRNQMSDCQRQGAVGGPTIKWSKQIFRILENNEYLNCDSRNKTTHICLKFTELYTRKSEFYHT